MRLTYLQAVHKQKTVLRISFKFGDAVMHMNEDGQQRAATIKEVDYLDPERTFYIHFKAGGYAWCNVESITKIKK